MVETVGGAQWDCTQHHHKPTIKSPDIKKKATKRSIKPGTIIDDYHYHLLFGVVLCFIFFLPDGLQNPMATSLGPECLLMMSTINGDDDFFYLPALPLLLI